MKIKWNGHASFTITAADGTVLVTDPYDPDGYEGALKYSPVSDKADGVLVSHEHADHNHVSGLPGSPKTIRASGEINGIRINGIPTYHDASQGTERGENMVFVFSVDNVRNCFVGDLGHTFSSEQVKAIGPLDLLMIPVGGTFTIDAEGASKVVHSLSPKVVIPMHFKTAKCDFPIAGVDAFLEKMDNIRYLKKSECRIFLEDLPASGTAVWVLDYAC